MTKMDNDGVTAVFNEVYSWWKKHRDTSPADNARLDLMAKEGYDLIRKHGAVELVTHMVNDLVNIAGGRNGNAL